MPRFYLEFERTSTVKETGGVSVEVPKNASIQDIYKQALSKEFKEFLVSEREYTDEQWEFTLMRNNDDKAA